MKLQRRWIDAAMRGDVDAATDLLADDHLFHDRRSLVGNVAEVGAAANRRLLEAILEVGITEITLDPVATRGDHLALNRLTFRTSTGDEVAMLNIIEADPSGSRLISGVTLDVDDMRGAQTELELRAAASTTAS